MANTNNAQSKNSSFNPFDQSNNNMFSCNWSDIRQTINKNIETIAQSNAASWDMAKEVIAKNVEMVQKGAKQTSDLFSGTVPSQAIQDAYIKQQEAASSMMQNIILQAQEVADVFARATKEILDIQNKRFQESVAEASKK